jgi:hypothetical protein
MPPSDRAFRALARAEPHVVLALLAALDPLGSSDVDVVTPDDVDDSRLDAPPPPTDADFVARVGDDRVEHAELQGYGDTRFEERVFGYHLALVLRYPSRVVRTRAIWLVGPPRPRVVEIRRGNVTVTIEAYRLADVPVSSLLARAETVCFAPGSAADGIEAQALCDEVAWRLVEDGATLRQWTMALVAARVGRRYEEMKAAMRKTPMEPVIIEDLVNIAEEIKLEAWEEGLAEGRAKGLAEGRAKGLAEGLAEGRAEAHVTTLRATLERLATRRFGALPADAAARIASATTDDLERWIDRVLTATSPTDLLA